MNALPFPRAARRAAFRLSALPPTLCAFLALSLAACSGGDAGGEWAGTELDSAGIHLVHNPAEGLWSEGEAWTFEEDLRIGALEGPVELQFGQITAMDVDAEGNIYVADSQAQEIRVFGSDGSHLRTLGGPGNGPGELGGQLTAVFADDDGRVRVVDLMNQRVNTFAPDGSSAGSFPLDMTGGIPMRWEELPSGRLLAQLRGMNMPGMDAHEEGDPLVVFSDEGEVVDTVHYLPRGQMMDFSGGVPSFTLFETEPLWEAGPGGTLLTAVNTDYRVQVRDADASIRHVLTRPFERRPVEEADKEVFLRLMRQAMEDQGQAPPQAIDMMMDRVSFAESYPAFGNLLAGPLGSVWVQRILTASDVRGEEDVEIDPQDLGSPDWDVFDPQGRFLGVVTLPRRFTPMTVREDALYGVWLDDLDVQHVLRLRIQGASTPTT